MKREVGGRLIKVEPLMQDCASSVTDARCTALLEKLKNPYYVGDQPAGTQSVGWVDAWMSKPSVYAIAAKTTQDVAAGVNFARENKLRLVVKGGGHSYQGTSNAADSLLIWTRAMSDIVLHEAFVPHGCADKVKPQPAVSIGAGAIWMHVYDAVVTKAGRYVQGGGCATVGVAGLIQSGGFGSFSKNYGTAAGGLLEAEVVTADGKVRIANACTNPDLFWGIKGGGGGSLGVVTRLTLKVRELPPFFGGVGGKIKASSDAAFHRLIGRFMEFFSEDMSNAHWGESVTFGTDNTLDIGMVFQGLGQQEAEDAWKSFIGWVGASPSDFIAISPIAIRAIPARHWWDPIYLNKNWPGHVTSDPRPGAPTSNAWFAEQKTELGAFFHGFESAWLPASLLEKDQRQRLNDAIFAASRHWGVAFHFNKGLAGTNAADVAAAKDTAMNPGVLDAFALIIISGGDPGAYLDLVKPPGDLALAREHAAAIGRSMKEMLAVAPGAGAYLSESNFFDKNWRRSFWGDNYRRLKAVKAKYDPEGLFFVHHGVGSDDWSDDGFTRVR